MSAHEEAATSAANPIERLANTHFRGPIAALLRAGDMTKAASAAPASADLSLALVAVPVATAVPGKAARVPVAAIPIAASLVEEEAVPSNVQTPEQMAPVEVPPAAAAPAPAPAVAPAHT